MLPINDSLSMFEIQTFWYRESKTASCVENPIHIVFEHRFTTPRLKPKNQWPELKIMKIELHCGLTMHASSQVWDDKWVKKVYYLGRCALFSLEWALFSPIWA